MSEDPSDAPAASTSTSRGWKRRRGEDNKHDDADQEIVPEQSSDDLTRSQRLKINRKVHVSADVTPNVLQLLALMLQSWQTAFGEIIFGKEDESSERAVVKAPHEALKAIAEYMDLTPWFVWRVVAGTVSTSTVSTNGCSRVTTLTHTDDTQCSRIRNIYGKLRDIYDQTLYPIDFVGVPAYYFDLHAVVSFEVFHTANVTEMWMFAVSTRESYPRALLHFHFGDDSHVRTGLGCIVLDGALPTRFVCVGDTVYWSNLKTAGSFKWSRKTGEDLRISFGEMDVDETVRIELFNPLDPLGPTETVPLHPKDQILHCDGVVSDQLPPLSEGCAFAPTVLN